MSTNKTGFSPSIEEYDQLIKYFESGEKPTEQWRIGTEHEKFCFTTTDLAPLPYDGESSILTLLHGLIGLGWKEVRDGRNIIALEDGRGASISLEPGGQFELSGEPLANLHETCAEVHRHLAQVKTIADAHGIIMVGLGFTPERKLNEIPLMPKTRYGLMKDYMPKVGKRGHDMMFRTCTIQVNLDYGSESDMSEKMRLGHVLQPFATALFANSPIRDGYPSGRRSERAYSWLDVDQARSGLLKSAVEGSLTYEAYVEYALDVPMYFVLRDGPGFIDARGQSFRDFLQGNLPAMPGELPTMNDWENHLSTLFPEARLKKFIEMRGADGGPWKHICGLPAFWVGLLYDSEAQDAAMKLTDGWDIESLEALRQEVPKIGMDATYNGKRVQTWLHQLLKISVMGLRNRAVFGKESVNETEYLDEPFEWVISGEGPAQKVLKVFNELNGDMPRFHRRLAF